MTGLVGLGVALGRGEGPAVEDAPDPVDGTVAVLDLAGRVDLIGLVLEDRLDPVGGVLGVVLQHGGDDTGGDGSGLRGAGAEEEAVAVAGLRHQAVDGRAGHPVGGDRAAGGGGIRVPVAVAGGRPLGHGAFVAVVGQGLRLDGADGDHVGVDGGRVEMLLVLAPVPGGDDHHDAGVPGSFDGGGQVVADVGRDAGLTEAEVEHPDVQAVGVAVLDDPVDGGHDLGDGGDAIVAGHLHAHDASPGSDAGGIGPVAGDDGGHVGAVAVGVEVGGLGRQALEGEVRTVQDLVLSVEPSDRRHATVDDGHVDALTSRRHL